MDIASLKPLYVRVFIAVAPDNIWFAQIEYEESTCDGMKEVWKDPPTFDSFDDAWRHSNSFMDEHFPQTRKPSVGVTWEIFSMSDRRFSLQGKRQKD